MSTESVIGNGMPIGTAGAVAPSDFQHPPFSAMTAPAGPSALEIELDAEIATIKSSVLANTQPGEVAVSFLCRARALARDGKNDLAERARKAARTALTGKFDE